MKSAYSTSFPCMAAAEEFSIPFTIVVNFAWGIILNARGLEQSGWTRASAQIVHKLLGSERMVILHDKLLATAMAQGIVPKKEMPR